MPVLARPTDPAQPVSRRKILPPLRVLRTCCVVTARLARRPRCAESRAEGLRRRAASFVVLGGPGPLGMNVGKLVAREVRVTGNTCNVQLEPLEATQQAPAGLRNS